MSACVSHWLTTQILLKQRLDLFTEFLRFKFQKELGREVDLTVYFDGDTILVVTDDDEVYINTDDEPLLFIGERRAVDVSECVKEIEGWQLSNGNTTTGTTNSPGSRV